LTAAGRRPVCVTPGHHPSVDLGLQPTAEADPPVSVTLADTSRLVRA
jgi:hypothetical protein